MVDHVAVLVEHIPYHQALDGHDDEQHEREQLKHFQIYWARARGGTIALTAPQAISDVFVERLHCRVRGWPGAIQDPEHLRPKKEQQRCPPQQH